VMSDKRTVLVPRHLSLFTRRGEISRPRIFFLRQRFDSVEQIFLAGNSDNLIP
jgi:hypothetical protein